MQPPLAEGAQALTLALRPKGGFPLDVVYIQDYRGGSQDNAITRGARLTTLRSHLALPAIT